MDNNFANWRFKIHGLVENPLEPSLTDLHAMKKQMQITVTFMYSPLQLRVETQLGYKMVKWIKSVEFVSDYKNIGMGQGGHREDNMYYGIGAGI
jgi:DMSO/TMAO reductase YedYZ molybdopterin-dependent catalytic subunit